MKLCKGGSNDSDRQSGSDLEAKCGGGAASFNIALAAGRVRLCGGEGTARSTFNQPTNETSRKRQRSLCSDAETHPAMWR